MKVSAVPPAPVQAATAPPRSAAGRPAGFTATLERTLKTSAPAATATVAATAALLAVQEIEETLAERRRRAFARGNALLDALAEIRNGLVEGRIAARTMRRLAGLLAEPVPDVLDAALQGLLREIELRAAVELAKLERDGGDAG